MQHSATIATASTTVATSSSTIQEGDHVQTPNGYQPVIGRFHADAEVAMPYHVFWAEGMDVPMGISDDHWLYIDGIESDPATAKVGQTVSTPNGPRRITKIEYYRQRGAYHIIVPGGMYYVDGTSRPPCPTRHRRNTFV